MTGTRGRGSNSTISAVLIPGHSLPFLAPAGAGFQSGFQGGVEST